MPQTLPQELLDVIAHYVPFRAAYAISRHVAITKHKTVDFEVLTQEWTDAINSGNLARIQWLVKHNVQGRTANVIERAALTGSLEMIIIVGKPYYNSIVEKLIKNGFVDVLDYAIRRGEIIWTTQKSVLAARHGVLGILKLVKKKTINSKVWLAAAESGQLHIIKWLQQEMIPCFIPNVIDSALSNGHAFIGEHLLKTQPLNLPRETMDEIAASGLLSLLQNFEHDSSVRFTKNAMNFAAKNGHLNVVIWLHENRKEGCTTLAMDFASRSGHYEVVEWLHFNRQEGCTERALNWAVENEHFKIVKFLCAYRSEIDAEKAGKLAKANGSKKIMNWLELHTG